MTTIDNLQALIDRLKAHPAVTGIVQYGARSLDDMTPGGDFDVFVFTNARVADVEGLHFFAGPIPVDLNLRTLADVQAEQPTSPFDLALLNGTVLYDATGELKPALAEAARRWQTAPASASEAQQAFLRFSHSHLLHKVRYRLESAPLLAELLMSGNLYWLVQNYFAVRCLPFPGERAALAWLETNAPAFHAGLQRFFEATTLDEKYSVSEELTRLMLEPGGDIWREGTLLALGTSDRVGNLQAAGERVYRWLLG